MYSPTSINNVRLGTEFIYYHADGVYRYSFFLSPSHSFSFLYSFHLPPSSSPPLLALLFSLSSPSFLPLIIPPLPPLAFPLSLVPILFLVFSLIFRSFKLVAQFDSEKAEHVCIFRSNPNDNTIKIQKLVSIIMYILNTNNFI